MSAESVLEKMGISLKEAQEADQRLTKARSKAKSNKICSCGHPTSRHTITDERAYCKPSRYMCHCKQLTEVLEVGDNRIFFRKTNSYGAEHALTRGIVAAFSKEVSVKELETFKCQLKSCRDGTGKISPTLIELGLPDYPEGKLLIDHKYSAQQGEERNLLDVLMCASCLDEYILRST